MVLTKHLQEKTDHGDIDILLESGPNVKKILYDVLGSLITGFHKNGNITSILFNSQRIGKSVHVDFIAAPSELYLTHYDYLSYNDFSGVIGLVSRRLNFKYSTLGFFKKYEDKRGQWHSIHITNDLLKGLAILGYNEATPGFSQIKTYDDIVKFISSSDFFDSRHLTSDHLNHSDRKRLRVKRVSANIIKTALTDLNKHRSQEDDDFFLKSLYPMAYRELMDTQHEIESYVPVKSKYDGTWIINTFDLKPGPIFKDIMLHWTALYGDDIDSVEERELIKVTSQYLRVYSQD
jgi:hypothetical protein